MLAFRGNLVFTNTIPDLSETHHNFITMSHPTRISFYNQNQTDAHRAPQTRHMASRHEGKRCGNGDHNRQPIVEARQRPPNFPSPRPRQPHRSTTLTEMVPRLRGTATLAMGSFTSPTMMLCPEPDSTPRSILKRYDDKHYSQRCDCSSCKDWREERGHPAPCNCTKCREARSMLHRGSCNCGQCAIYKGRRFHSMDCLCTRCDVWWEGYRNGLLKSRMG